MYLGFGMINKLRYRVCLSVRFTAPGERDNAHARPHQLL